MKEIEEQHGASVAMEEDPERKKVKQRQHEKVAELLRKEMTWQKLEPIAVETYSKHLQEEDTQAMLAFLATPAGQDFTLKYMPALVTGIIGARELAGQRTELIWAALFEGKPYPEPMNSPKKPKDATELAAQSLIERSGRAMFAQRISEMDAVIQQQLRVFGPTLGISTPQQLESKLADFSKAFRNDANFNAYMQPFVTALSAVLTESELNRLSQAFAKPEWKVIEEKFELANKAFQEALSVDLQQRIMPLILDASIDSKTMNGNTKGIVKRCIYIKLPLEQPEFHWVFTDRGYFLTSTNLTLEVFTGKDKKDKKYTFEIINNGGMSPEWTSIDDDEHEEDDEIYFGFTSHQQFEFSATDYAKLTLIVQGDLDGIGADHTGTLKEGTYISHGLFSIFDEEVYDAGSEECVFLEKEELKPDWKLEITGNVGWN
jgi:hypothetical protein